VFIDDALLETKDNVALTLNSLNLAELRKDLMLVRSATDITPFQPDYGDWRETIYDHDGKVYLFINDSYTSQYGISRLYVSKDGLNFTVPNLGMVTGLPENYIFYKRPMGATIIKDQNPNISPEERFKITAYGPNRGIYLHVSADGIRWRRNELAMLPLIHGGDPETFWDDQQGEYVTHLKRDSSYHTDDCPGNGRRGVRFSSVDPFRPWPMQKTVNNIPFLPYFEYYPMPAVTCQGLVTFPIRISEAGREDVYRTRAMKYSWAPDTYVALIWRGIIQDSSPDHQRRQVELGVSRNGTDWSVYDYETYGYYMPSVGMIGTADTREVQSFFGLIRRGDKLWHYAEYNTKNNSGGNRRYSRLEQRLDGFVSLDAGDVVGYATTRLLVFTGKYLELNVKADNGSVRVGILDKDGNWIPGFGLYESFPLTEDSVRARVQWVGGSNVENLAGQPVRLVFELQNAKLYALQFFRTGCDANYDGKVDRSDISVLMDARDTSVEPDDPRDVDGDGRITVGDSRACALRCDKPQCAP